MERFKLQFINFNYVVNEKEGVVICICKVKPKEENNVITVTGIARAGKYSFDVNVGKKLARARAEKQAYIEFKNHISNILETYVCVVDKLVHTIDFMSDCIDHQDDYIKENF